MGMSLQTTDFKENFRKQMEEIALNMDYTPEEIAKDGPLGLTLVSSIETFEMCCELEDAFGVDLSDCGDVKDADELAERVQLKQVEQTKDE